MFMPSSNRLKQSDEHTSELLHVLSKGDGVVFELHYVLVQVVLFLDPYLF